MNSGRVVLMTGAAGGIGTALVDRFLSDDDDAVVAADLDADTGHGCGRIINFSSASVYSGVAEQVAFVAAKAVFLASPGAVCGSGRIINVDGGSAKH